MVKELLTCRFIDEHRNVILVGRPSTGKTMVANHVGADHRQYGACSIAHTWSTTATAASALRR